MGTAAGRWRESFPASLGISSGAEALRRIVEAAPEYGIDVLTVYAFSSDNWKRPQFEVDALMALFACYLTTETARCIENDVRMTIIGRRDRLPGSLIAAINAAERQTQGGGRLQLRIAVDYSARDAILTASSRAAGQDITREQFEELLGESHPSIF